nr:dihydrodipicolinate synthase [Vibrio anguillarum]
LTDKQKADVIAKMKDAGFISLS